jgi:hypothetical protein
MGKSFSDFELVNLLRSIDFIVGYKGDTGEEIRIQKNWFVDMLRGTPGVSVDIQYSSNADSWHYPGVSGDTYVRFKKGFDAWSPAFQITGTIGGGENTVVEITSAQYSADGTAWHDSYADTDIYIRFMMSNGSYTNAIRIRGLDGQDGAPGPQGPQGIPGTNGLDGQNGTVLSQDEIDYLSFINRKGIISELKDIPVDSAIDYFDIDMSTNEFSLSDVLKWEKTIFLENKNEFDVSVVLPTSGNFISMSGELLEIPAQKWAEIIITPISDSEELYNIRAGVQS